MRALTELKDPADKAMNNALTAIDGKTHDAMSSIGRISRAVMAAT